MNSNSSEIKLCTILSPGWLYRGEGNANLVLSLPKARQILRIKKCEKPKTILWWLFNWLIQIFKWDHKKDLEYEKKNLDFYNLVMVPLLGYTYAHPAISIDTSRNEIQVLDQELMLLRPEYRRHKRLQFGTATLFQDYAFLPNQFDLFGLSNATYAIEIKPKQGWIPVEDRNFDKCQFCLNQHLKLKNSQITELTSYCPLDLFSGNKERMIKALKSLIINPQNNFRVFRDGIYCYGENISIQTFYDLLNELFEPKKNSINSLIDDFCNLLEQALLKKSCATNGCVNCDCNNPLPHKTTYFSEVEPNKCRFSEPNLPLGCVLEKILSLQKLNCWGLDKYRDIYKALNRNACKFNDWGYVGNFLKEMGNSKSKLCPKCIILKRAKAFEKMPGKAAVSDLDLVPYLIAAVANDCSFMVTCKKVNKFEDKNNFIIKVNDSSFLVNVGVFDLYPKPLSTVEKHVKRNLKVQKTYMLMNTIVM